MHHQETAARTALHRRSSRRRSVALAVLLCATFWFGAAEAQTPKRLSLQRLAAGSTTPTLPVTSLRTHSDELEREREQMVASQIEARGVDQPLVLAAMREVPRHMFVPEDQRADAYADHPLAIGEGQTISQPYVVALMTQLLELEGGEKILEIGTGSGYHAAVLSRIAGSVFSIEIIDALAERARGTLQAVGYDNVEIKVGDGYQGWQEEAPFDAIVLTAAPEEIPPPLLAQLKVGGRMVAPVGGFFQELKLIIKHEDGIEQHSVEAVRFVKMTGEAEKGER